MSHLNSILEKVRQHGEYSEPWYVLLNGYFRSKTPREECQAWAEQNGLTLRFEERPGDRPRSVDVWVVFRRPQ